MFLYLLLQVILCIVITEALTELVVKSEIFKPFRQRLFSLGEWFQKLFSCGYCFSVWVAFGVVFITQTSYPLTGNVLLDLGFMALAIHRLSNILHNVIDKWTDKYYDTRYVNTVKE